MTGLPLSTLLSRRVIAPLAARERALLLPRPFAHTISAVVRAQIVATCDKLPVTEDVTHAAEQAMQLGRALRMVGRHFTSLKEPLSDRGFTPSAAVCAVTSRVTTFAIGTYRRHSYAPLRVQLQHCAIDMRSVHSQLLQIRKNVIAAVNTCHNRSIRIEAQETAAAQIK